MTSSKANLKRLRAVAARQNGCFTAAQALQAGYADSLHPYHLRAGDWIRVYRGVYRLASAPDTAAAACSAALLWSRGKSPKPVAALHPDTAARLAQNPSAPPFSPIRLLVPKTFRRSAAIPDGIDLVFGAPLPAANPQPKGKTVKKTAPAKPAAAPAFDDPYYYTVPRLQLRDAPLGGLPSFFAPAAPVKPADDPYFAAVPPALSTAAAPLGGLPSFLSPSTPGYPFPKRPAKTAPAADRYDWADFRAFFE